MTQLEHIHAVEEAVCAFDTGDLLVIGACGQCGHVKLRQPAPSDADLPLIGALHVEAMALTGAEDGIRTR